jgi:uncharacterized protein (DUF1330 family)
MTTHAIVTITLKNAEAMAAYREKAGAALAVHGGAVLQASTDLALLEGSGQTPDAVAVLTFPNRAAAQSWIDDPALASVHALRNQAADTMIILL